MGDKSLKSKERNLKRTAASKVEIAALAKTKQDGYARPQAAAKVKK
jgi:hypothetical protein